MIFRNSMAATAAKLTGYAFSFILAPIMLAQLGLAAFGVWAVLGAITVYAGLMDLGITRAISRFVAFFHTKGDRRAVEECFGLGLVVVATVSATAALLATIAAPLVARALGDVLSAGDTRLVMYSVVAIFAFNGFRSVMGAVPEGLQQMVPPYVADIVSNVVNFAFSLIALFAFPGDLVIYGYANAAAGAVALVPAAIALRMVWSPVRVRWPSRRVTKEVLGFSVKTQLAWVGDLINTQADKIIIAMVIDVRAAGAYEIANRAVVAVRSIAILSISAMVPAATTEITRHGTGVIGDFYRRYTTRSLAISLPLLVFSAASAPAFLIAWLGEVPPDAMLIFMVLVVANMVNMSCGVAFTLSLGAGKAGMVATSSGITVAINLGMTLLLTPFFGLWGVVAGTVCGIVGGALVFVVYFHRAYGIPAVDYIRSSAVPAAAALLAGVPTVLWLSFDGIQDGERVQALAATSAFFAAYVMIYWPLASRLDILPEKLNLLRKARTLGWSRA